MPVLFTVGSSVSLYLFLSLSLSLSEGAVLGKFADINYLSGPDISSRSCSLSCFFSSHLLHLLLLSSYHFPPLLQVLLLLPWYRYLCIARVHRDRCFFLHEDLPIRSANQSIPLGVFLSLSLHRYIKDSLHSFVRLSSRFFPFPSLPPLLPSQSNSWGR